MLDLSAIFAGSEESSIAKHRQAFPDSQSLGCNKNGTEAEGASQISPSTDHGVQLYLDKALNNSSKAGRNSHWQIQPASYEELLSDPSFFPQEFPTNPEYSAHETSGNDAILSSEHALQQTGVELHTQLYWSHESPTQDYVCANLNATNTFLQAYRVWDAPINCHFPQNCRKEPSLMGEESSHDDLGTMQQPQRDTLAGPVHEGPWSPLGHHTISGPNLIFNRHPQYKGYGSSPKPQDMVANFGPVIQQADVTHPCGASHPGSALRYAKSSLEFDGTQPVLRQILTPASSYPASESEAFPFTKQRPIVQLRTSRSLPGGMQIDWNSKTGQPLVNGRTKRRQTQEERLSSQAIRRRGGPCDPCRFGHRKVTFSTTSVVHLY
jgi:hypothetical protein